MTTQDKPKPFSSRCMTLDDWRALKYFTRGEFSAPDKMGLEFMLWLDELRRAAGVPMHITSSYRDPAHNERVGGAGDSAHCDVPCNAVDIGERPSAIDPNWNYSRFRIVSLALAMGCQRIGTYANGSLHLDMTHATRPAPRMWRVVGKVK